MEYNKNYINLQYSLARACLINIPIHILNISYAVNQTEILIQFVILEQNYLPDYIIERINSELSNYTISIDVILISKENFNATKNKGDCPKYYKSLSELLFCKSEVVDYKYVKRIEDTFPILKQVKVFFSKVKLKFTIHHNVEIIGNYEVKFQYCNLCIALHLNINDNFYNVSFEITKNNKIQIKIILSYVSDIEKDHIDDLLIDFMSFQSNNNVLNPIIVVGRNSTPLRHIVYQLLD